MPQRFCIHGDSRSKLRCCVLGFRVPGLQDFDFRRFVLLLLCQPILFSELDIAESSERSPVSAAMLAGALVRPKLAQKQTRSTVIALLLPFITLLINGCNLFATLSPCCFRCSLFASTALLDTGTVLFIIVTILACAVKQLQEVACWFDRSCHREWLGSQCCHRRQPAALHVWNSHVKQTCERC